MNCCNKKNLLILPSSISDNSRVESDNFQKNFEPENLLLSGTNAVYKSNGGDVVLDINLCADKKNIDTVAMFFGHLPQGVTANIYASNYKKALDLECKKTFGKSQLNCIPFSVLGLTDFAPTNSTAKNFDVSCSKNTEVFKSEEFELSKFQLSAQSQCGQGFCADSCNDNDIVIFKLSDACNNNKLCFPYWRIEIKLPINKQSESIEISRLIMGEAFRPSCNFSVGATLSWMDESISERTISGRKSTTCTKPYRRFKGNLEYLNEEEAFDNLFQLDCINGKKSEYLVSIDPDTDNILRFKQWTFLASMAQLGEITFQGNKYFSKPFVFEENI